MFRFTSLVGTLAGGLIVAAVGLAAPAGAGQGEYLSRLDKTNVNYVTQGDAIHWGNTVCDALRNGAAIPSVIDTLRREGGFTARDAGTVIGAATSELCPDQYQNAADWAQGPHR